MKLLDLDLTDDRVQSLLDILDRETQARRARDAAAERDAAEWELSYVEQIEVMERERKAA